MQSLAGLPDQTPFSINSFDPIDRKIVELTQEGLPLTPQPYHAIADQIGIPVSVVKQRMQNMLDSGVIRRIGAVPNHYKLGYTANGMSVWDVPDHMVTDIGQIIGQLAFVSHCYRRPRHLPDWPYNIFVMVHGRSREEVQEKVDQIAATLGPYDRGHTVLYSTAILKKTGLRLRKQE